MRKYTFIISIILLSIFVVSFACVAQDDTGRRVIRDAVVGAGTGAIASGASGGKAGKGALIGAGTGALGGVLMDILTQPSSSKEDKAEKAVATQEVYQLGYENGYKEGFQAGFQEGLKQAKE